MVLYALPFLISCEQCKKQSRVIGIMPVERKELKKQNNMKNIKSFHAINFLYIPDKLQYISSLPFLRPHGFVFHVPFTLHFKFSARTKTSGIYSRPLRNKIYHTPLVDSFDLLRPTAKTTILSLMRNK